MAHDKAPHRQCAIRLDMPGIGVGTEHWQAGADIGPCACAGLPRSNKVMAAAHARAAVILARRNTVDRFGNFMIESPRANLHHGYVSRTNTRYHEL